MDRKMILYRGSLKSCNYACSYCPFSKHPFSGRELEKDKKAWMQFCESFNYRAGRLGLFALMVVPYGEALIHPWYWEGLGALSSLERAEAVGAQTNLSFSLEDGLKRFAQAGGKKEKLRLWATFHPEMLAPEEFAAKCRAVQEAGITICAGAVGVPENLFLFVKLRSLLPESVYLWINRMDGLNRSYTPEEEQAFSAVDPFFCRELVPVYAEEKSCQKRLFVEADGRMRTCNISAPLPGNWYQEDFSFPSGACRRKRCSCYLAYGGRDEFVNALLFGEYPLFRIPRRFPAAFFDIDGTLLRQGEKKVSPLTAASLQALAERGTWLFFATSLPLPEAQRKCREIWPLFEGGIFAGGAHLIWKKGKEEMLYPLEEAVFMAVEGQKTRFRFRLYVYRRKGVLYKITLSRPNQRPWEEEEAAALKSCLPKRLNQAVRFIREENYLQIIAAEAGKAEGVREICRKTGISPREAAAAGNSAEDEAMMALCGITVWQNNH